MKRAGITYTMAEEFYTAEEVARRLRVSVEKIKFMLRKGQLPGYKIGNQWRIDRSDLEEFLAQQRNVPEGKK